MPHFNLNRSTAELVPGRLGPLKTVREWKALAKYTSYKSHKVFYVDSGEGEAMLCLHGFPLTTWGWGKIWPRLSHSFRMLSLDHIGTGYSDKPAGYVHSVADDADQVEALLASLDIEKIHILAHGAGVTVAQELLARGLARGAQAALSIQSVIFLNGGIVPGYQSPFIQHIKEVVERGEATEGADEVFFGRMMNSICGESSHMNPQFIHESWFLLTRKEGLRSIKGLMHYLADREKFKERWGSVLAETSVPIHCILGLADPVWGEQMLPQLRQLADFDNLIKLSAIGNFPHLEAPSKVVKHIRKIHQAAVSA